MNRPPLPKRFDTAEHLRSDVPAGGNHANPSAVRTLAADANSRDPLRHESPRPRLLRFPTVRERTGLSRSTIWRLERRGEFPRHHRISANAVAWVEGEIIAWIQQRTGEGVP